MKKILDWLIEKSKPKKRQPPPEGPRYADLYERGIASAMDMILLFGIFHAFFMTMTQRIYGHMDRNLPQQLDLAKSNGEVVSLLWHSGMIKLWLLNATLQVLVLGVAIVGVQILYGTTPGKWLMGISIRRVGTLEKPALWRYPLRFLGYMVAALPMMIGMFWVSFNTQRRGWHDYIAGTVVVHDRPRGWCWQQVKRGYAWLRRRF